MLVALGTAVSPILIFSCVTRPEIGARSSVLASCSRACLQLRPRSACACCMALLSSTFDWSRCERTVVVGVGIDHAGFAQLLVALPLGFEPYRRRRAARSMASCDCRSPASSAIDLRLHGGRIEPQQQIALLHLVAFLDVQLLHAAHDLGHDADLGLVGEAAGGQDGRRDDMRASTVSISTSLTSPPRDCCIATGTAISQRQCQDHQMILPRLVMNAPVRKYAQMPIDQRQRQHGEYGAEQPGATRPGAARPAAAQVQPKQLHAGRCWSTGYSRARRRPRWKNRAFSDSGCSSAWSICAVVAVSSTNAAAGMTASSERQRRPAGEAKTTAGSRAARR